MVIPENTLIAYGATYTKFSKGEVIFYEGASPKYYFQIVDGIVELTNYYLDGKEFVQNILSNGQPVGEALLFNNRVYPMNAIAKTKCIILKLPKEYLFSLLNQNYELTINILKTIAERLYFKYLMLFSNSSLTPQFKIKMVMDYYKSCNYSEQRIQFPFTRRQLASLTGLRIETVIRAIKKMAEENILEIKNGKIFY